MTVGHAELASFATAYAEHRAAEGRGYADDALFDLPYLRSGAFVRQWQVRARTFDAFRDKLLRPLAAQRGRPLNILDIGAGNGWLSHRVALEGHRATALDIRTDAVDGLGAAVPFVQRIPTRIELVAASFEAIPESCTDIDIAVFNASLHYAVDLARALRQAQRTLRPGGKIAILDSPFYRRARDGDAMVAEKQAQAAARFGDRADALLGLPFIEFLTRERLEVASADGGIAWRRHRVLYPIWYELRGVQAVMKGARAPSRFDLWIGAAR